MKKDQYDMRLLLMLLLACIILETSDNGVKFGKLYACKLKKNTPLFNLKLLNANVIDKWYIETLLI